MRSFGIGKAATLVLPGILAIHALLLAWGAVVHSPTLNEPGHLVAGISNLRHRQFHVYKVNPPLVRVVAALPVLLAGIQGDYQVPYDGPGARPEFDLGSDFVAANGQRSTWLYTLARWACIPFSLIGGYFSYRWARELYGQVAGLVAVTLWCFSPDILAHGQLITSDTTATAFAVTTGYWFWRWLRVPTWWSATIAGLTLGLAVLAKSTLVFFFPLWPLMWLVYRWSEGLSWGWRDWLQQSGMLAAQMLLGLYVINIGYMFEGTGTKFGDFRFVSSTLAAKDDPERASANGGNRFAGSWLADLPVPLPKNFILGIDLQKHTFEVYSKPLNPDRASGPQGKWYFYLYALAIKGPLGTWFLISLAATRRMWLRGEQKVPPPAPVVADHVQSPCTKCRDEFILLCPAVVLLLLPSFQTKHSEHLRYILPVFPFVFVWTSRIAAAFDQKRWLAGIAALALAWTTISSLSVYPHSLSYFNEIVGGPVGGAKHLIHSQIDWGQDYLLLKRWMDEHPEARPLNLAYFAYYDPRHLGIEYVEPEPFWRSVQDNREPSIPPGWYAVSVNFVQGYPYFTYSDNPPGTSWEQNSLAEFERHKPVAMIGYTIYIYHIESEGDDNAQTKKQIREDS